MLKTLKQKLDLILRSIEDKKSLLAKEEDAKKQAEIVSDIDELNKQAGRTEAEIEAAEKTVEIETAETKSKIKTAQADSEIVKTVKDPSRTSVIEVGTPAEYKGYNFKKEVAGLKNSNGLMKKFGPHIKTLKDDTVDLIAKTFLDIYDIAVKNPIKPGAGFKAAMQEDTAAEGGYFVHEEVRTELLALAKYSSIALNDCTVYPMRSKSLKVQKESGSITLAFEDEEEEIDESEPGAGEVELTAKKIAGYSKVSNELIADTFLAGGIAGMLLPMFVDSWAQKIDSAVFIGTGSPVSGIFLSAGYSEVFSTGSTNFSELLESNLRNLVGKIPKRYIARGKWYIGQANFYNYFAGLKNSNGDPLFWTGIGGNGPIEKLMGYPVAFPEAVPANATGAGLAVFGDLAGFIIGERMHDLTLKIDPYTAMGNDQTKFYFITRTAFAHGLNSKYGRIATSGS